MFRITIVLIITLSILNTLPALGCFSPPEHMYVSHEEAIDSAEWIVRAKAIRREDGGFKMLALEYLKGSGPETFVLQNATTHGANHDSLESADSNYFAHEASKFWVSGGRSRNEPDCRIHPSILFGEREYLIFGPLDYNVGFENIAIDNDRWLEFIRDYLKDKDRRKPFPKTVEDYFGGAAAIVRFRAEWKDGRASWVEDVLKGAETSYARMLFVSPPAFFDTAVNPDCTVYDEPRKLKSFDMLYVIEKLPTGEILASQYLACSGADQGSEGHVEALGIFSQNGTSEFNINTEGSASILRAEWFRHSSIIEVETVTLEQVLAIVGK